MNPFKVDLTLAVAHDETQQRVLGPNASDQDRLAYRRAFYMGARAMHGLMLIAGTHPSPHASAQAMEALDAELRAFDLSRDNPLLGG